jgi:hypothetical protein
MRATERWVRGCLLVRHGNFDAKSAMGPIHRKRSVWHRRAHALDSELLRSAALIAPSLVIRIVVIVALILIVGTLGTALYYLYHDRGGSKRMVKALAIRVALSACLLIFLVVSYELGWIGEQGLR